MSGQDGFPNRFIFPMDSEPTGGDPQSTEREGQMPAPTSASSTGEASQSVHREISTCAGCQNTSNYIYSLGLRINDQLLERLGRPELNGILMEHAYLGKHVMEIPEVQRLLTKRNVDDVLAIGIIIEIVSRHVTLRCHELDQKKLLRELAGQSEEYFNLSETMQQLVTKLAANADVDKKTILPSEMVPVERTRPRPPPINVDMQHTHVDRTHMAVAAEKISYLVSKGYDMERISRLGSSEITDLITKISLTKL